MGVYLPIKDYSAMQGPAPDGFHVPLSSEWVALCGILTSTFRMASNATTMGTYLKMPMAGYRNAWGSNVLYQGSYASYWSSSCGDKAEVVGFHSSALGPGINYRSHGFSVRCFKNSPAVPTSSWTRLYDGSSIASGAGVFYNATDGLISVSGDGTTWYTIMDKNLGATTVFNQGNTLREANCGKYYQWGNNYGFARTGSITTSSTQVDARNYGPGNYYSSSTFITGNGDWSSVRNDNLWGGVTGIKPMSELKNAYIGEVWKPGANTIAYYPLNSTSTVNDMSGNNHTLTNVGSVTFDSISATFSGSNYLYCSPLGETNPFTVSFWLYIDSSSWDSTEKGLVRHTWGAYNGWHSTIINHSSMPHTKDIRVGTEPDNKSVYTSATPSDGWHNVIIVCSTSNMSFYLDTILQGTNTAPAQTGNNGYFTIGTEYRTGFGNNYKGKISDVIVESGLRDGTARANYYNLSKSKYGII